VKIGPHENFPLYVITRSSSVRLISYGRHLGDYAVIWDTCLDTLAIRLKIRKLAAVLVYKCHDFLNL
jgi:hypothetical protein